MKSFCILSTFVIACLLFVSCKPKPSTNVIEVTARDFNFFTQDSIPSGWTTFQFKNEGHATHFFFLTQLPKGITFQRYHTEVLPPFVIAMDSLKAGESKADVGALLGRLLPKWYASAKVMGGAGLTAPGKTSQTTLKLEPGNYSMECYIKTEDGKFHSELGMIRPITVTQEHSGMKEPDDADVELTLSNFKIESKGELSSGKHTVAVHFKEHPKFGLGNDVHLVRLKDDTNMDEVINWLDWMNVGGLRTPAPAEFLGGTQEMPVGYTAYFTVDLEPGNYAWISESSASKGMVKRFSID